MLVKSLFSEEGEEKSICLQWEKLPNEISIWILLIGMTDFFFW
jgi:hypothetical protein